MSEQWSLLALVLAVAAGLVTAVVSTILVRVQQTTFFRFFLAQVLLFNMLILVGLVFRYLALEQGQGFAAGPALLVVLAGLKLAWLYTFSGMTAVLAHGRLPEVFQRRLPYVAVATFVAWALLFAVDRMEEFAVGGLELLIFAGAIVSCVGLLVVARSHSPGARTRSIRLFGAAYLFVFAVMVGSLALGWTRGNSGEPDHLLFNSVFLFLYNLLPLAWVVRLQPVTTPVGLDGFGLTAREREVVQLISAGNTNQEIADRLYISLATVKDHNSNVFKKVGVRNRVELVNRIREES